MWKKIMKVESQSKTDFLLVACLILAIIGGITNRMILLLLIGLFLFYIILNQVYDKLIGKKLHLQDTKHTIRLFPGDTGVLLFQFDNTSLFPYLNGKLRFHTNQTITFPHNLVKSEKWQHQCEVPLSIVAKGKSVIEIPFLAEQRGITTMNSLGYSFPHLFKFHSVLLSYIPFFKKRIIVYPKPIAMIGLDDYFHIAPGSQMASLSPFEDMEDRIGTRDYTYSDPFHRINWKASVKTQRLQTNTYEKVIDRSLIFMINFQEKDGSNLAISSKQLENFLSYSAYLAKYATEKGYPFELYMNTRKPGHVPYVDLPEGQGTSHYIHALEMLARVHQHPITFPFSQMVYRTIQQLTRPKTIIIIGDISPETEVVMASRQKKHTILQVKEVDDEAILKPFKKGG